MNKIVKTISIFMIVMILTAIFCSCAEEETAQSDSGTERQQTSVSEVINETDGYLLDKAKSDYKIILADDAALPVKIAAEEFNLFFKKATRTELPVVSDKNVKYDAESKYISLADNAYSGQAGVNGDSLKVNTDGFAIKTKGKSIFVVGKGDYGVLYGVYQLLSYLIGFECYGIDNEYYEENISKIRLYDYDVVSSPSFPIRPAGYGCLDTSKETLNRMRLLNKSNTLKIRGALGHTSLSFLPPSIFYDKENHPDEYHPDWYYVEGTVPQQLCYSAHGNEQELEKMIEECAAITKQELIDQPEQTIVNMSLQDNNCWCNCDKCQAESKKYGSDAAVVVKFLNRLSRKIYDWFDTEEGKPYKRDVKFIFYAYFALETPPANYDETSGKWTIIDESVKCDKNVVPQVCITVGNYTKALTTEEINKSARRQIEGWSLLADDIFAYMYSANYKYFLIPYDTFNAMQDWYKYYYDKGSLKIYDLGQGNEYGTCTGWSGLKMYLNAKLSWYVDANTEELTENYFKATYKDGAENMKKVFDEYRVLSNYNSDNTKGYLSSVISAGPYILKADYWPYAKLLEWRDDMNKALAAVSHYEQTDLQKYERTTKAIRCERIWVNYLLYGIYSNYLTSEQLKVIKTELYDDLTLCKITKENEHGPIDPLLKRLKE